MASKLYTPTFKSSNIAAPDFTKGMEMIKAPANRLRQWEQDDITAAKYQDALDHRNRLYDMKKGTYDRALADRNALLNFSEEMAKGEREIIAGDYDQMSPELKGKVDKSGFTDQEQVLYSQYLDPKQRALMDPKVVAQIEAKEKSQMGLGTDISSVAPVKESRSEMMGRVLKGMDHVTPGMYDKYETAKAADIQAATTAAKERQSQIDAIDKQIIDIEKDKAAAMTKKYGSRGSSTKGGNKAGVWGDEKTAEEISDSLSLFGLGSDTKQANTLINMFKAKGIQPKEGATILSRMKDPGVFGDTLTVHGQKAVTPEMIVQYASDEADKFKKTNKPGGTYLKEDSSGTVSSLNRLQKALLAKKQGIQSKSSMGGEELATQRMKDAIEGWGGYGAPKTAPIERSGGGTKKVTKSPKDETPGKTAGIPKEVVKEVVKPKNATKAVTPSTMEKLSAYSKSLEGLTPEEQRKKIVEDTLENTVDEAWDFMKRLGKSQVQGLSNIIGGQEIPETNSYSKEALRKHRAGKVDEGEAARIQDKKDFDQFVEETKNQKDIKREGPKRDTISEQRVISKIMNIDGSDADKIYYLRNNLGITVREARKILEKQQASELRRAKYPSPF